MPLLVVVVGVCRYESMFLQGMLSWHVISNKQYPHQVNVIKLDVFSILALYICILDECSRGEYPRPISARRGTPDLSLYL